MLHISDVLEGVQDYGGLSAEVVLLVHIHKSINRVILLIKVSKLESHAVAVEFALVELYAGNAWHLIFTRCSLECFKVIVIILRYTFDPK